jgi:hypothetical protein
MSETKSDVVEIFKFMLTSIVNWIKKNKLSTFLIFIILFLILKNKIPIVSPFAFKEQNSYPKAEKLAIGGAVPESFSFQPSQPTESQNRLIIKESYLSLVVKNVFDTQKKILEKTQKLGGFMVQSYFDNPQEAASATITIRVPAKKLDQALNDFKKLAVKVVSQNLSGSDVTEEYTDIEARLTTLYKTKTKFEEIMEKANRVQDILEVQRELINLQGQIDALVGQKKYLEKSADLAKITIYLSTDELSLPYAPTESWQPQLVFKQAVRSLILTLRKIANLLIWVFVYLPIIIPLVAVYYFWKKKR